MIRPTIATVNLEAIRANCREIADLLARESGSRTPPGVIAVVKANAYGHGSTAVGPALEAADQMRRVMSEVRHLAAHKIDSTLRGNWPAEIEAAASAGRRVLMVPAYPNAGRVWRGGVGTEEPMPSTGTPGSGPSGNGLDSTGSPMVRGNVSRNTAP